MAPFFIFSAIAEKRIASVIPSGDGKLEQDYRSLALWHERQESKKEPEEGAA